MELAPDVAGLADSLAGAALRGADAASDEGACAICLDAVDEVDVALVKQCLHAFCTPCIVRWTTFQHDAARRRGALGPSGAPDTAILPTERGRPMLDSSLLLAAKADPNLEGDHDVENGTESFTPLEMACSNGDTNLVRLLLEHGADPNAPPCIADGTGRTSAAYLDPVYEPEGTVVRAEGWGTTPLSLLGCYVPTFPVLLLYCVGTRDARVLRWCQNRSWMMGSGGALLDDSEPPSAPDYRARRLRAVRHSHAHDFFMMMLLSACNGAVRYLTLEEGRDIQRAREWIHGALMLFGNSIMYAVYSAEFVRPGRKRLDIPAVVIAGAALYGCPPNAWAKLARAPSPASAAAELFLLQTHLDAKMAALSFFAVPCLAAALARRACRVHNRLALFAKVDAAAMVDPAEANAKRTS